LGTELEADFRKAYGFAIQNADNVKETIFALAFWVQDQCWIQMTILDSQIMTGVINFQTGDFFGVSVTSLKVYQTCG